jgi:hydrogenase expression/formation protein HypC
MCLAIPGKVVSVSGDDPLTRMGRVDFSGVIKQAEMIQAKIKPWGRKG